MIMGKWTVISTNKLTKGKEITPTKIANIIKHIPRRSYDELEKASKESFNQKIAREDNLLQAYENKKLKSKALIKEAKSLKANKAKQNKECGNHRAMSAPSVK